MNQQDFLLEVGCEELPAQSLLSLQIQLKNLFSDICSQYELSHGTIKTFATPRRLAVIVSHLSAEQAPRTIERRGPALQYAYDKDGTPTMALLGFAKANGVTTADLEVRKTDKGEWLFCKTTQPGKATIELLPELVEKVLMQLQFNRSMRWNEHDLQFLRPIQWVCLLYGNYEIKNTIFNCATSRLTLGHRFHHPQPLKIDCPANYIDLLKNTGYVIADFDERKKLIETRIHEVVRPHGQVVIEDDLLNEVTGLVEWPVVLLGKIPEQYLELPPPVLITALRVHQKCFPVHTKGGKLAPYFVLVSNIESKDPKRVVAGNERVINARLADARFFYQQDTQQPFKKFGEQLTKLLFQDQLGTMADKVGRITELAGFISKRLKQPVTAIKRAASLCKNDLMTAMVGEFPSLQGIMGYYYALLAGEDETVAMAIHEHYKPRFAGDELPLTLAGKIVALADRIDSIVGILGVKRGPTGDKDPFGMRRAALGVARLLSEDDLDIDLTNLLEESAAIYKKNAVSLVDKNVVANAKDFIIERLRAWQLEQGIRPDAFAAVHNVMPKTIGDYQRRLEAVNEFINLIEAQSLVAANKRVTNILRKQNAEKLPVDYSEQLLQEFAERELAQSLQAINKQVNTAYQEGAYTTALQQLSSLKQPVDNFFDNVMIMVDNKRLKTNRLKLLKALQQLFTKVADISLLQLQKNGEP